MVLRIKHLGFTRKAKRFTCKPKSFTRKAISFTLKTLSHLYAQFVVYGQKDHLFNVLSVKHLSLRVKQQLKYSSIFSLLVKRLV